MSQYLELSYFQNFQVFLDDKTIVACISATKGLPPPSAFVSHHHTSAQTRAIHSLNEALSSALQLAVKDVMRQGSIWGEFELYTIRTYAHLHSADRIHAYAKDAAALKAYLLLDTKKLLNPKQVIDHVFPH